MELGRYMDMIVEISKWLIPSGALTGICIKLIKSYPEKILESIHLKILRKLLFETYIFIVLVFCLITYPVFIHNHFEITYKLYGASILIVVTLSLIFLFSSSLIAINDIDKKRKVTIYIAQKINILFNYVKKRNVYFILFSIIAVFMMYYLTQSFVISHFNESLSLNCKTGVEFLLAKKEDYYIAYALYPYDLSIRHINNPKILYLVTLCIFVFINRMSLLLFNFSYKERKKKQLITIITMDNINVKNYEYINSNSEMYVVKDFKTKKYQIIPKNTVIRVILQDNIEM